MADDAPTMISTSSAICEKAKESERIRLETEAFLARGGSVIEVQAGVIGDDPRFIETENGKRKLVNNTDVFSGSVPLPRKRGRKKKEVSEGE